MHTYSRWTLWFVSAYAVVAAVGGATIAALWLLFLDERQRSRLSFVIPPSKSPWDVYDIRDWCDVYDECLDPKLA